MAHGLFQGFVLITGASGRFVRHGLPFCRVNKNESATPKFSTGTLIL
jgi:hypothetical protein